MRLSPLRSALPILVTLLTSAQARAEIREVLTMTEALGDAREGDLVVLDLDNTLIRPVSGLGSDEWFYHLEASLVASEGLSGDEAADRAMAIWNEVQAVIDVRPVEPYVPALVRSLQARGIELLGLTARTRDIMEVTRRQLASVGIDLSASGPRRGPWTTRQVDVARYRQGILFVGEHNEKGAVLAAFLGTLGRRPGRVLFVDDRGKHVRSVDGALSRLFVPCIAFRYGAADAEVARFDPAAADRQYEAIVGSLAHPRALPIRAARVQ